MLRAQSGASVPEIERLIKEVVKDDNRYVLSEMRSVHRENVVVPVTLAFRDGVKEFAFSRNLSPVGVCLISKNSVPINTMADLEIYRLNGDPSCVIAESRWCKPFGQKFFMSGWKFMQLKRK